jgi:hypothetical protein
MKLGLYERSNAPPTWRFKSCCWASHEREPAAVAANIDGRFVFLPVESF